MISNYAENSFIKISCFFRTKVYHDSCLRVMLNSPNCLIKAKGIARISVNLEVSRQVTVIYYIQDSVCFSVNINFTKM